jgi:DNA-binding transcriptional LysR family regulator
MAKASSPIPSTDGADVHNARIEAYLTGALKMRHLKLLLTVADLGKVGKVAAAFGVSQPAISRQISEVEASLGLKLFDRVGHLLQLTSAGEDMVRSASAMLTEMEDLAERLGNVSGGIIGKVRLGGVATTFASLVPGALAAFKAQAPRAAVALIDSSADQLLAAMRGGTLDLFVGRLSQRAIGNDIRSEKLLDDPTVIVSGMGHPLARKRTTDWNSLAGQEWIVPPAQMPEHRATLQWLEARGVRVPTSRVESRSLLANIGLLETGNYLSLVPQSTARLYARQRRLSLLPFPPCNVLGPLLLVWRDSLLSPAVQLLADCLRHEATVIAE